MNNDTNIKILVVDDSLIMRRNIRKIFKELGHIVVGEATTGKDAIEMYKEHRPDVITMDITMPDMNGIEAVELIKDFSPDVKVIMMTAHGQEDMVIQAIKAGAKAYILKPVTAIKIVSSIDKLFNLKNVEEKTEEYKDIVDDFSM